MSASPKVSITQSEVDGHRVVQIDSDENEDTHASRGEPQMRVYLNDACLYENPEFPAGEVHV